MKRRADGLAEYTLRRFDMAEKSKGLPANPTPGDKASDDTSATDGSDL